MADIPDGGPGGTYFGFGFCVFLRTERQEISRISFTDEVCKKNRLGGYRLETDTDSTGVRSGDIREITWTNVQAIESQGDPTQGGIGPSGAALPPSRSTTTATASPTSPITAISAISR
jgi:hypothetical protein